MGGQVGQAFWTVMVRSMSMLMLTGVRVSITKPPELVIVAVLFEYLTVSWEKLIRPGQVGQGLLTDSVTTDPLTEVLVTVAVVVWLEPVGCDEAVLFCIGKGGGLLEND